jgi:glutamyl-tRNA synthetase
MIGDDAYAFDPAAGKKSLQGGSPTGAELLRAILPDVKAAAQFDPLSVQAMLDHAATMHGVAVGSIAQPLRVALTGGSVSPPINLVMALLGKDSTVRRIERCLAAG